MRKTALTILTVSMMLTLVGCGETEAVKPYEQVKVTPTPVTEEATPNISDARSDAEEESNTTIEEKEPEGSIAPENTEENTEEVTDNTEQESENPDTNEQEQEQQEHELEQEEEEYIDNGARSDRTIPMGRAYIGNLEFTPEKIAEKFSGMDSYETNEMTAKVAEDVIIYLTTKSEYDLINIWSEYDDLEQSQRYALIVLTRYEQSFGGYNKSSMSSALKNSETYKQDIKTIDSDLK